MSKATERSKASGMFKNSRSINKLAGVSLAASVLRNSKESKEFLKEVGIVNKKGDLNGKYYKSSTTKKK